MNDTTTTSPPAVVDAAEIEQVRTLMTIWAHAAASTAEGNLRWAASKTLVLLDQHERYFEDALGFMAKADELEEQLAAAQEEARDPVIVHAYAALQESFSRVESDRNRLRVALEQTREPIQDGYACERCRRRDGLDAVAPNAVWATLVDGTAGPAGEVTDGRWKLLCLWCMDELAAEKGIRCSVSLHFEGRALTGTSDSDAHREHVSRLVEQRDAARLDRLIAALDAPRAGGETP